MATLALTVPSGTSPRDRLKRFAKELNRLAETLPDTTTGGATVVTIDNSPATGFASATVSSGPYSGNAKKFGA